MAKTIYEKRTVMKTSIQKLIDFHNDPKALSRLTPPPIFMQLHQDNRTSLTEGVLEFTLWFLFIPIRWIARHEPGPTETSFADRMVKGPLASWYHQHIFEETSEGVALIDRLEIEHYPGIKGILTRLMFDGIPLRILFFYRHLRTKWAVEKT
ncbi:MAG: hypothetical protein D6711_03135 [Chloroflexi bacterium]|nr:MAG: hypothetical protein D6711_03135 [Chloroflexota bacterium]